jgi:hypothetical protein
MEKRKTVSRKGAGGAKEERKVIEGCLILECFSLRLCARFFCVDRYSPEVQIEPLSKLFLNGLI